MRTTFSVLECPTGFISNAPQDPQDKQCEQCPHNQFGHRCLEKCSCRANERYIHKNYNMAQFGDWSFIFLIIKISTCLSS